MGKVKISKQRLAEMLSVEEESLSQVKEVYLVTGEDEYECEEGDD